jgi:hypothetical protein
MARKKPTRRGGRTPDGGPTCDDQAPKQRFLVRAKALSEHPEVFRRLAVTQLICDAVAFGGPAEADIFQAAYGDPSGRKYWNSFLSEAIPVVSVAYTLSVHLAESVESLGYLRFAILCAFRDAAEAGERWFTGDTTTLLAVKDFSSYVEGVEKVKVDPDAAVRWLLSKPMREHLVPDSLRRFLQWDPTNTETPTARRPVTEKSAERFVVSYIDSEQAAEKRPTLANLESAANKAGMRGGREYLRAAFHRLLGAEIRRGRPPKASTKIAEK